MKLQHVVAFLITIVLASCQAVPAQVLTNTVMPTETPSPIATPTPRPSPTKRPTTTATPTETPIPTRTFAPIPSERPEGDQISGTYVLERGDGGYCATRAVLQPFVPVYEEVVVELFCLRGPPSYNSGYAPPQKLLMSNDLAVYSVSEDEFYDYSDIYTDFSEAPCHIVFQFGKDQITVTQLGMSSCGFGHAVFADGVYKLVDPKPPVLGCLSIWDACSALYPLP